MKRTLNDKLDEEEGLELLDGIELEIGKENKLKFNEQEKKVIDFKEK